MASADDAIRARRRLTNKFIAAHEAERLRPFFAADAKVIVGDGGLIVGQAAIIEAFAGQFADPDFVTYVRTPERVTPDEAEARASEAGTWIATWRGTTARGDYLAMWRKVTGQWVIEAELFVTLREA